MIDRLEIAARAMEGILIAMFSERPSAKPPPAKIAQFALTYADALIEADRNTRQPQRLMPGEEMPAP